MVVVVVVVLFGSQWSPDVSGNQVEVETGRILQKKKRRRETFLRNPLPRNMCRSYITYGCVFVDML